MCVTAQVKPTCNSLFCFADADVVFFDADASCGGEGCAAPACGHPFPAYQRRYASAARALANSLVRSVAYTVRPSLCLAWLLYLSCLLRFYFLFLPTRPAHWGGYLSRRDRRGCADPGAAGSQTCVGAALPATGRRPRLGAGEPSKGTKSHVHVRYFLSDLVSRVFIKLTWKNCGRFSLFTS